MLNIWLYDLSTEGNISNKRLFFKFSDLELDGIPDRCLFQDMG